MARKTRDRPPLIVSTGAPVRPRAMPSHRPRSSSEVLAHTSAQPTAVHAIDHTSGAGSRRPIRDMREITPSVINPNPIARCAVGATRGSGGAPGAASGSMAHASA
jgi:hypothetical protein